MTADKKLIQRMLRGDEQAFDEFFAGYFPRLFRFALTRIRDEAGAEEVVQETLIKVIDKLATYRGEAPLFSWLCTFCRHEIGRYLKKSNKTLAAFAEDIPDVRAALESLSAADSDDPESMAFRSERARLVQVALDALPPHYGDALEWKYIEGLSVQELAARLELGQKATESLLVRARRAFRDGFGSLSESR